MFNAKSNDRFLFLAGFLTALLLAYTWTTPLRDIYGMDVRNALITREMLEKGMTFIPRVLGQFYPDYPPLYFWLEALFSMPFGHVTTLTAILPSALFAVGLVALTYHLGCKVNLRVGWLAALILATSPTFWLEAGSATIDMLLAFNVTAAIMFLYFKDLNGNPTKRVIYMLGAMTFIVLSFLTKGPIGVILPAAVWGGYLLFQKRPGDLLRFALLIICIGTLCASAELLIAWHSGGMGFVHEVINMQVAGRVGHKPNKPIYYYLVALLGAGGPWLLWCIPAVRSFGRNWRAVPSCRKVGKMIPQGPLTKLMLIWFLTVLAIFTAASTKHGRYILPLFPPLAILLATLVDRSLPEGGVAHERLWRPILGAIPPILAIGGLGFILLFYPSKPSGILMSVSAVWCCAVLAGWFWVLKMCRGRQHIVALLILVLAVGLSGFNVVAQPLISQRASGRPLVEEAERQVSSSYPVAVYKIEQDGDGLKYALYSSRKPESIMFVSKAAAIKKLSRPCILVAYEKNWEEIHDILKTVQHKQLAAGSIRSKAVVVYLLEP